jgi:hypothetical protein
MTSETVGQKQEEETEKKKKKKKKNYARTEKKLSQHR